ncbi:MAG TPA: 4-(cytidine 5'-diphospho)-2-C-methyl-D-erythritol kinase [Dehalococcoidia bacterium]|nr:4-(cytidine 5'-diphospho)-2-C-methyl-D-erythritol kinase [Dehalococcoidia bacterium]
MPARLELRAPAKINLTLEVIGRRPDGYHELATIMQTIDLCDTVCIEAADSISIEFRGERAADVPFDPRQELAHRAADLMSGWLKAPRGARIVVDKQIPAGAGLGGGSSDAAAVLRGLNALWGLGRDAKSLARSAARLGSDVPFFIYCGSALCRGRGEIVDPLTDGRAAAVTLFLPKERIENKTATMYSLIQKSDYTAGTATRGMADDIAVRGEALLDGRNVFDRYAWRFGESVAVAMDACNRAGFEVHFAGSGPAFFALRPREELPPREAALMEYLGIEVRQHSFLPKEAALAVKET